MRHLAVKLLTALGRLGSRGIASSILIGISLPWLGRLAKPFLTEAIIVMLTLAFLRVRPEALIILRLKPWKLALVLFAMMVVTPAAVRLILPITGPSDPGLILAIAMQAAGPSTMTAAAFAAMLGLDAAYALGLLILSMLIAPFTAPLAISAITGQVVPIDTLTLALRLGAVILGSIGAAALLRRLIGAGAVERNIAVLDGLNMLMMFFFAIAVMDGVAAMMFADPWQVVRLVALVFTVVLALTWVPIAAFAWMGFEANFTAGLAAGHRNMGVLIAAWTGTLPVSTWDYFAMAQFPIYLAPIILGSVARRLRSNAARGPA